MGLQDVDNRMQAERLRAFMRSVLQDLQALELMLEEGMIESNVNRIGAEQEMFLIDTAGRPAAVADQLLASVSEPHFAPELGRFNLEVNLDPLELRADCLMRMKMQAEELVGAARAAAAPFGADVILTGILPTLVKSDLGLENMMPQPRYAALNEGLTRLRGGDYEFRIKGVDELNISHDSVMLEACNASFQAHFQVSPEQFPRYYNIAQVVLGPVLAAAANSPLLFGKRLWRETRIALFQQSIDTRTTTTHVREQQPRVYFGSDWIRNSALEIFQEDIARFRAFMTTEVDEDSLAIVRSGKAPKLRALRLHNSTVYRWNRACYGVAEGKAHLRIENRVLPSGPTILDQIGNCALWYGAVAALAERFEDITEHIAFNDAHTNFMSAARHGLSAQLIWLNGEELPARELLLSRLIPLAREGLVDRGVDESDIDQFLGVVEQRVRTGRTGARWILDSLDAMSDGSARSEPLRAVTAGILARQREGGPVHEWSIATRDEAGCWTRGYQRVEQYMTTDLFTVNQDEVIDLVAAVMDWRHVRHVPVEDDHHRLVGIVSHRALLRILARSGADDHGEPIAVSSIMTPDPITIAPATTTLEAIQIMRRERVGCLPVVDGGRLVGIVTERDFLDIAGHLIEQGLLQADRPDPGADPP